MRRRLGLLVAASTALVVIAFVVPMSLVIRGIERDDEINGVVNSATSLAAFIDNRTEVPDIEEAIVRFETENPGIAVTVYGRDGVVVGASAPADPEVESAFAGSQQVERRDGGVVVLLPNNGPFELDRPSDYVIRLEASRDVIDLGVRRITLVLVGSTIVAALVGGVVGLVAARSISDPTRRITATARQLQAGDLSARATPEGPPELRELAETLNHLAGRIDDLLVRERESVADIAHRLRTPLTALHLEIETLPESPAADALLERAQRLEDTLSEIIADMRRRGPGSLARSDLVAIAQDRLGDWAEVAEDGGRPMAVTIEPTGPRPVAAGVDDLEAALDAILNNALMHTPPGTAVAVTLVDGADAGRVRFVVEDAGPGFPDEPDEDVTTRGHSGQGSSGLGLDIVRRTVEGAGGDLELTRSPTLGGALVRLTFPWATVDSDPHTV